MITTNLPQSGTPSLDFYLDTETSLQVKTHACQCSGSIGIIKYCQDQDQSPPHQHTKLNPLYVVYTATLCIMYYIKKIIEPAQIIRDEGSSSNDGLLSRIV